MFKLLKALVSFICGNTGQEPPPEPTPPQSQQQYQHHYPPSQQQQWQYPPVEHKPQHAPPKPHHQPFVQQHQQHPAPQQPPHHGVPYNKDQNVINQQNSHYVSLRSQANEEGDAMARCFEESHQAYSNGDGALAKELSNKGKQHQKRMEDLNRQASDWVFIENNKVHSTESSDLVLSLVLYGPILSQQDSQPHEVDLHGLYVKEAIAYTDRALQQARTRGDKEIHLIVGKGLHSKNGAKIKPAIEELIHKYQLSAELDPNNTGVLIVQLDSTSHRGVGADEITRRIERNDDRCIIM